MPNITISTEYSVREEFVNSFILMSDIYQSDGLYPNGQLPKLLADIKMDLCSGLKEYAYLLPLFCHKSYKISLFSNCRMLFIPKAEDLVLSAEELISRVLTDDPDELAARVFMTVDENANDIVFYRKLIAGSLDAVKHCLNMDIEEELRTILLSLLVGRKEYHVKMINFAYKTLNTLRCIFGRHNYGIRKVLSAFGNNDRAAKALLEVGYIHENETVIILPILLNPGIIYITKLDGVKHIKMGFDFQQVNDDTGGLHRPTLELELIGKILGDPTRCEIIRTLKNNGSYLTDLARRLEMPTNSLHYHMQALSDAGVIKGSYKGKRFVYELNPQFFYSASNTLMDFSGNFRLDTKDPY